mgnify:CR=1 FL=1
MPTTAAPRARKLATHALPIPEAAPVTRATSPAKGGVAPAAECTAAKRGQRETVAYQADYLKLWHGFLDEATATLTRDVDDGIQSALALLRRECHVKAS